MTICKGTETNVKYAVSKIDIPTSLSWASATKLSNPTNLGGAMKSHFTNSRYTEYNNGPRVNQRNPINQGRKNNQPSRCSLASSLDRRRSAGRGRAMVFAIESPQATK